MRKNSCKHFCFASLAFSFMIRSVYGSYLITKIEATSAVLFHIFQTIAFLIKKSLWKVHLSVMTLQELKMV